MSHFAVLVIGDNPEEQLKPYQENNMGDCPEEYLSFFDQEEDFRKEYETEGCEMVRCPDGDLVHTWDDRFRVPGSIGTGSDTHRVPDSYEKVQVLHKERFPTFDAFVRGWHEQDARDPKTGRYGYYENRAAKWDWYALGGRWTGFFKLKSAAQGELGERGVFGTPPKAGWVDQAKKSAIDWEGMQADELAEHLPVFDQLVKVIAGREVPRWKTVLDAHQGDVNQARIAYNSTPVIVDIEKIVGFHFAEICDMYCDFNREKYIEATIQRACTTFAVVKDGKWYEKGEMGWWGVVHDEKAEEQWTREFQELLKGLPPDTLISVYDCHI